MMRVSPVTQRRAVAFGDLLHLVVVSQHKERLLEFAHLLYFGHHILVDSIHDLLNASGGKTPSYTSDIWSVYSVYNYVIWWSDCSSEIMLEN